MVSVGTGSMAVRQIGITLSINPFWEFAFVFSKWQYLFVDEKCMSKDFVEPPLTDDMITVQFVFGSQGASGDFFFSC